MDQQEAKLNDILSKKKERTTDDTSKLTANKFELK